MLAPHELKNKTFAKTVRGYNPIDVDEYIDFIIGKYTEIYRENMELEKKLKSVAAKLDQIRDEEESIRTTLLNAQKMAERIVSDATARAELITESIKERSDAVIARFRDEINAEKDEMWEMRTRILDFKKKLFDAYREHIEALQTLSVNEIEDIVLPDEDKLIADVFTEVRETIKNAPDRFATNDDAAIKASQQVETEAPAEDHPDGDMDAETEQEPEQELDRSGETVVAQETEETCSENDEEASVKADEDEDEYIRLLKQTGKN